LGVPGQAAPIHIKNGRFTVAAFSPDSLLAASLATAAAARDSFPFLPRPTQPVLVSIAPDRETFRAWLGAGAPEWGAAFAFPHERRVIMQGRSAPSDAGDPRRVLRHELAHLALFEALGELPPRWFDEGYASFAAGEWDRELVVAANVGLALRGFKTLAELDSAFYRSGQQAEAAYALAHRAVVELAALDTVRGLALFFNEWKERQSFDLALRQSFGITTAGFEARWRTNTRRRYGGLALFADVTLGAFVLLLFVTPLYLQRRKRDALRMERLRAADAEAERRARESAIEALLGSPGPGSGRPDTQGDRGISS
jgi:hypothetical protein